MLSPGWHITPISFQPVPSLMEKVVVFRQLLVVVVNHPTKCFLAFSSPSYALHIRFHIPLKQIILIEKKC